ncbi:hypothetical protein OHT59_47030 [Streptomyces sp. NBC_00243]|uniref:hypothetical protein n=1 Tax=Streptomyces sp. NBC_00243 TaxID=2975688 RepID=UPI002DD8D908|nr:hypothetical protein [Streptomyces sp. NBC_00243]WRZ25541.1 hypothetical protein OHT59_47030 [Streptomyces sp. NBC_00243]
MTGRRRVAANGLPTPAMVLARHRLPVHARELRAERRALAPYAAFRERHYEPYLQYAGLRIGRHRAAESAVTAAFTELAVSCPTLKPTSSGPSSPSCPAD